MYVSCESVYLSICISIGVIIGNITNPIHNLVMENVVVNNAGVKKEDPWGLDYYCANVEGTAVSSSPIPDCMV